MRILVIGGTGFIGPYVVRRLAGMGHSVAVFHRGNTQADLPAEHIFGGRQDLPKIRPDADVVIDLILSSGMQAQALMEAFRGVAQRVVQRLETLPSRPAPACRNSRSDQSRHRRQDESSVDLAARRRCAPRANRPGCCPGETPRPSDPCRRAGGQRTVQ